MDSSSSEMELIEQLADEFTERQERGEQPTLKEYVERYPELASEIREVFPALVMMEHVAPAASDLKESQRSIDAAPDSSVSQIGDYRILREIGRGGMGVVYEAEQESLGRRVALKVLLNEISTSPRSMQRFQREARAAARMHHTNIVPVFEVGQEDSTAFYAMQLIQGQGLDLVIDDLKKIRRAHSSRSRGNFTPSNAPSIAASLVSGNFHQEDLVEQIEVEPSNSSQSSLAFTETADHELASAAPAALPGDSEISTAETNRSRFHRSVALIGMQAADALAYAHARGIIHRDIKPSNLILDATGVIWVTDFGLAKTNDEAMTHTGDILGTMRYMSPERFRGQCDVRADVYSLGLTLYELLVLSPAFDSSDRLKLIEMVRELEPARPRSIEPRIPRDLETIVLKSIDKDPKRRYQSADDLSEDLRRFVDDEPISARRISLPERLVRWSRRNKGAAALLVCIAVLLVAASIVSSRVAAHFRATAEVYRRQLYRTDMAAAMDASRRGEWDRVEESLRRHVPTGDQEDLRRFEWYVHFRQWRLASKVPTLEVGTEIRTLSLLGRDRLLVAHNEGLTVLNVDTGARRELFASEELVLCASVSPHNSDIAVSFSRGGILRIHRVSDGELLMEDSKGSFVPRSIAFAYNSSKFVTGAGRSWGAQSWMDIWDLELQAKDLKPITKAGHGFADACFSPDDRLIATAGWDDHLVIVWDAARGTALQEIQAYGPANTVHFTLDGRFLIAGFGDRSIRVWRTSDYQFVHEVEAHRSRITQIAVGPEGQRFASASIDSSVRLWQLSPTGRIMLVDEFHGHTGHVNTVCFLPDRRIAAGGSNGKVKIWNTKANANRTVLRGHTNVVRTVDISPDGNRVASGGEDSHLRIWDLMNDESFPLEGHTGTIRDLSFSPTGQYIVTGGWDNKVILWDVRKRKLVHSFEHVEPVWNVRFAAAGEFVVAHGNGSDQQPPSIWLTDSGEPVPIEHVSKQDLDVLHRSPDGKYDLILQGSYWAADGAVGVRDVARDQQLWLRGFGMWPGFVFFPEAMETLGNSNGNEIRLLELQTGEERARLVGHENEIWDMVVSQDGRILVSGSEDHTVRVWRAATTDEVREVGW